MTAIADTALTAVVTARIKVLLEQRAWDRRWMRATWTQGRFDRETELRALVRLMRTARRLARTMPDPYPVTMTYEAWTNGELVEAFGR